MLKVEIPVQQNRSAYLQVSEKSAFDWALVSCAAAAQVESGKISRTRIVLGAVANVPYQVQAAHELLEGKMLDEHLDSSVAELILQKAEALPGNAYKVPIAKTLIRRALMQHVA